MPPRPAAQPANPPDRGQLLRSVPAGYEIDRWPLTVTLRPEETIESWVMRAARRYALTPRALISESGVADRVPRPCQLARFMRIDSALLAVKLGVPDADVAKAAAGMLPNAAVVDYLARYRGVTRPVRSGTAFCPACLAEPDPYWRWEWSTMFAIACQRHECLLLATCPRCGEPPQSTTSWLSQEPGKPVYRCPNRPRRPSGRMMRGHRCKFDLRGVEPYTMDADALDAHRLAHRLWQHYLHAPASRLRLAGVEVTATIAFDALCALIDESLGILTLFDGNYERTKLVGALRSANLVLSAESTAAAAQNADAVGLLNPAGPATPVGPDGVLLRRPRNPLLAAIRLGSLRSTLSPTAQLMFDCGNHHPRYPIRDNADRSWQRLPEHHRQLPELDHARIPQVLWPDTIWASTDDTTTPAAAAQAMALTKIGDTRPWTIIALDLGLPHGLATEVTRYWRHVVRTGSWPQALAALTELKEQLRRHPPPIDYQQRRIIADDPRRLVRALKSAGADSRTLGGAQFHDVVRRYWERFTGGGIRYAAAPYTLPAEDHTGWPAKRAAIDGECGEIFERAYELMTTWNALRPVGPLTWRPP